MLEGTFGKILSILDSGLNANQYHNINCFGRIINYRRASHFQGYKILRIAKNLLHTEYFMNKEEQVVSSRIRQSYNFEDKVS